MQQVSEFPYGRICAQLVRGRQAVRFAPVPDRAARYTVASSHIGKAQIGGGLRGLFCLHRVTSKDLGLTVKRRDDAYGMSYFL